jgi:hypothetical protein
VLGKRVAGGVLMVVVPGIEFKTQPQAELVGTYDSFTQTPATATTAQAAVIVLRDGDFIPEKKKTAPVHHPAAHRPAH